MVESKASLRLVKRNIMQPKLLAGAKLNFICLQLGFSWLGISFWGARIKGTLKNPQRLSQYGIMMQ
jgi:hypothetical protein